MADHHGGCLEPADEHGLDEFLGRERGEGAVEGNDCDPVETERGEEPALLGERRQPEDRGFGPKESARMRLEREHHRRHLPLAGFVDGGLEQDRMAAVDTVEIADRDDAAGQAGRRRSGAYEEQGRPRGPTCRDQVMGLRVMGV